jgi:hypothetical protein
MMMYTSNLGVWAKQICMQNGGNEIVMRTINEDYDTQVWNIFSILNL